MIWIISLVVDLTVTAKIYTHTDKIEFGMPIMKKALMICFLGYFKHSFATTRASSNRKERFCCCLRNFCCPLSSEHDPDSPEVGAALNIPSRDYVGAIEFGNDEMYMNTFLGTSYNSWPLNVTDYESPSTSGTSYNRRPLNVTDNVNPNPSGTTCGGEEKDVQKRIKSLEVTSLWNDSTVWDVAKIVLSLVKSEISC